MDKASSPLVNPPGHTLQAYIPFLLILPFIYLWWTHAWLSDDINITFRTVLHFVEGHGIVWNPGERIQVFTHPAWFFLIAIGQFLTHKIFHVTYALSFLFSVAAFLILIRFAKSPLAFVPVLLLFFSNAFLDYSSSGLENPFSYFLVILIADRFLREKWDAAFFVALSLLALNRIDLVLLVAPLLIVSMGRREVKWTLAVLALLPVALWLLFSTFYFGFPFPNTLLGKMNTGFPTLEYFARFPNYLEYSLKYDPMTLILIAAGTLTPFFLAGRERLLALGIILYLLYLVTIGGDFMAGRFFSVPAVLAVIILASAIDRQDPPKFIVWMKQNYVAPASAALLLLLVILGYSPFSHDGTYNNRVMEKGIADERGFYFQQSSLMNGKIESAVIENSTTVFDVRCSGAGWYGLRNFSSYVYEKCGLASPYASRLPAIQKEDWRVGHNSRHLVPGFRCWLENPSFKLDDPELQRLFEDIRMVVSGPLFSSERLAAIYRINLTPYEFNRGIFRQQGFLGGPAATACPTFYNPET